MASTTMSSARIIGARPLAPKAPLSASRPARAVRVVAAAQDNQGPKEVVLKTFGALAAVQLALLPVTGTAVADIIPNQAERAEINERTSNLPTFGQVGDALKKNLGQNDPKDIGKAIDRNTPDLDLTKNPKDIGKDIKRGIERNTPNLPDLSELPNLAKQPNFFKGEGKVNARSEVEDKVKDAGKDIGKNLPNLPNISGNPAQKAADKAQGAANKAKNAVSDLSDLPNPFKGNADPQKLANDAKNKARSLKNEVGKNVPNVGDAKRAVDKNTPNLPNLGGLPGTNQGKGGLNIPRNS